MEKNFSLTIAEKQNRLSKHKIKSFFRDLKLLTKRIVLFANVLPVITGFWLALYFTDSLLIDHLQLFILVTVGSMLTIAGALILNNWYEVDLDREMIRTKERPTVTGSIPLDVIFRMGIVTSILGLCLMLFTTLEAAVYSFLGWFTYVVLYTFWTKRRSTLNTVIGSISGAFTPLIGWAAIDSAFHIVPITLFVLLFLWQIPHTFAIATRRKDEYEAAGVPMLPVVYGIEMTKRQTFIYILCLLPLPLFLSQLGTGFITISMVLNVVWVALGLWGLFKINPLKWAKIHFIYSLTYLTIIFLLMIVVTLPL